MKNWISILLIMTTALCVDAQEAKTYQYKKLNGKLLELDVYQPSKKNATLAPVIVFFHGGGLVTGRKEQMRAQCVFFAERGFVAVSANYHLLAKGDPAAQSQVVQCIKDAKTAVRWVKKNAEKLGVDTSTLLLGGGSAGGFLATQVALNDDINEVSDNPEISTKVKALILYNPAYTPVKRFEPDVLNFVSETAPPSILFYGDQDKFLPGGEAFYNKLIYFNTPAELWFAKRENHGYFNKTGWNIATNIKAVNFLRRIGLAADSEEPEPSNFLLTAYQ